MEFSEEIYRKIQRYLDGQLGPEERAAFEREMEANAELAEEVSLNREMKIFLADTPENKLRKNLKILSQQEVEPQKVISKKYWWWLLFIPVLSLVIWWGVNRYQEKSDMEEVVQDENTSDALFDTESDTIPLIEEVGPKEPDQELEERPTQQPDSVPKKQTPSENAIQKTEDKGPIAANFDPLPALEFLIDNQVRSDDFQWMDTRPQEDVSLPSPNESFNFRFTGSIISEEDLSEKDFQLLLFSNSPEAYEAFDPLFTFPLAFSATDGNTYQINFQRSLTLPSGLYYYFIEELVTERVIWINKFFVR